MGIKIVWSPKALKTFQSNIDYLNANWTEKEISNFTNRVNEVLELIKIQPHLYRKSQKKNIYIAVVSSQISLIYTFKPGIIAKILKS